MMCYERVKLGEVATIRGGKRLPVGKDFTATETAHPYIRARDIGGGKVEIHDPVFLDNGTAQKLARYTVNKGDVCLTIVGANVGEMGLVPPHLDGANLTENAVKIVTNGKADQTFLKYALLGEDAMAQMKVLAGGAAQPKLGIYKIETIEFPCPPLPVQRRIAGILSAYDNLMENSQRRIKILEEMARSLYREWFVNFRFPGHEKVPRVASPLGDIPQGWEVKRLDEVCRSVQDGDWIETKDQGGNDYRLLQISNVGVGEFIETGNYRFVTQATFDGLRCTEIKPGDILVARMPTPIGRAWLATAMPWRMITAVDVAIVRAQTDVLNPLFLAQAWNEPFNLQRIAAQASGTTRLRITRRELAALEFVVPPIEIQLRFAKFVEPQMEMIQALRLQIQNLRRTRDLLLPRLLSGHNELDGLVKSDRVS